MPLIVVPTRITARSATIIDHMYFFEGKNLTKQYQIKSGNLLNDLTAHLPNYMILLKTKPVVPKHRPQVRLYSEKNTQNFISSMTAVDARYLRIYRCQ